MSTALHLDSALAAKERALLLLEQMTVAEKARQLTGLMPILLLRNGQLAEDQATMMLADGIGGMAPLMTEDPSRIPSQLNQIQRFLVERTRLGIPALFHAEALNGVVAPCHPVFPTAIALAATWSPDLVQAMTKHVRRHMVRLGIRQALSPVLDVALDPRWGRVHETYGEDPLLVAALGVAFVRGLQGDDLTQGVAATAKHFLGYALGQGGLNTASYEGGSRFTRNVLAYPFEAAIHAAQLRSVMNSYGEVDGIPAGLSKEVLTDLLREELGFDGFTISDYMTLQQGVDRQQVAADPGEVARYALRAGLDMEAPYIFGYGEALAAEVSAGRLSETELNTSVLRVLRVKFELGLFDNPYAPDGPVTVTATTADGIDVAADLADRSVVLLENDGILPLLTSQRVAVIGPHGDQALHQFASYTHPTTRDMYQFMASGGLGNMVGVESFRADDAGDETAEMDSETYARFRYGARSLAEELTDLGVDVVVERGSGIKESLGHDALSRAVAAARDADVVVLALGGHSAAIGGGTEGEGTDTADIALPAPQRELADAVAATRTPTVAVLVQGRPYPLPASVLASRALLVASFAGQAGNQALARVLVGEVNPSGKLPYSLPRHGGQIPVYHHQGAGSGYRRPAMGHATEYLDMAASPQYPFGAGRTYTTFELMDHIVTTATGTDGAIEVALSVTNTGDRKGAEVVQLYGRVNASLVTRPAQQLLGFARVELEPGRSARVLLSIPVDELAFSGLDHRVAVEPATVDVFIGTSSDDRALQSTLQIVGTRRILEPGERRFLPQVQVSSIDAPITDR